MAVLSPRDIREKPYSSLFSLFVLWKSVLLILALLCPGPGYDTSTELLEQISNTGHNARSQHNPFDESFMQRLFTKLIRWDAIYFVSIAKNGYIYDQEWAFGWGFSASIKTVAQLLPFHVGHNEALAASLLANIAHLLSAFVLYRLTKLLAVASHQPSTLPFIAAALHIVSPAGLFLIAPYAEAPFSLLSFSAMLAYCKSDHRLTGDQSRSIHHDGYLLLSGLLFGLAATLRSNGIFAGSIYAYDLLALSPSLLTLPIRLPSWRHAICVIIAGLLVGLGFATPQAIAYQRFCYGAVEEIPEWCHAIPPSIYAYVQDHYWHNGFLRYWTLPNVPLFAFGLPMLSIMIISAYSALFTSTSPAKVASASTHTLKRLALPQMITALIILTCSHVQIITRLSSGYPLIYWWLASQLVDTASGKISKSTGKWWPQGVTRWMVMYAMIQGGLFASFLPPA